METDHSVRTPLEADPVAGTDRAQVVSRLFQEHNQALISFLLPRLSSEQEARDVAQEAYVRMLELESSEAVSFLRAYLFKIAANLAIDRGRQRVAQRRIHEQFLDPMAGLMQSPPADRTVGARQELDLLRQFMSELPPRCREAFYLHRFRDLSVVEIAAQLGVSDRMVRAYLVRAFEYCRQRLDEARGQS